MNDVIFKYSVTELLINLKTMKKTFLLLIFLMGTITFAAYAQSDMDDDNDMDNEVDATIENTFGIGPRLGYYKAEDADEGSFYGGLQARLRIGPVFGIEGAVDYRAGEEYSFGAYSVKTSSIPVTGSIMLFAPINEHFSPYGLAGIGAYYTRYDYDGSVANVEFEDESTFNMGYHLGFGAEIPLNNHTAFSVDYRYIFLNPDNDEESFEDASFNSNVFTAGLMFYF